MTKRPVEPEDAAERRKAKAVIAYRVDLLPEFDATGLKAVEMGVTWRMGSHLGDVVS